MILLSSKCYSLHLNSPSLVAHEGKAHSQLEKECNISKQGPKLASENQNLHASPGDLRVYFLPKQK